MDRKGVGSHPPGGTGPSGGWETVQSQGVPPAPTGAASPSTAGDEGRGSWETAIIRWLGRAPVHPPLFLEALTHASYRAEHPEDPTRDNERLEFLGDAVLNLCVTDYIFSAYPDWPEGDLSKLRAATVRAETLAATAERLGLGRWLRLGRGEEATGGRQRPSVLADAFEALVAALYLEAGLDGAKRFILRALGEEIRRLAESDRSCDDPKTLLQELSRRRGLGQPAYQVVDTAGPEHDPRFTVEVVLAGRPWGRATGRSKKAAEREAARMALAALQAQSDPGPTEAGDGTAGRGAPRRNAQGPPPS